MVSNFCNIALVLFLRATKKEVAMMKGNRMMFFIFMLGTFTVGMAEYVVTGLLTQIASDMKVSISSAGLLISVYAVSVALIGPFMRIFTMNVRAKRLLPILVAIFIGSNVVGMLAPNFQVLLLSRLLSTAMHTILWRVYECGCSRCTSW